MPVLIRSVISSVDRRIVISKPLRANALEDNVVLYKMERGKRSDLDLEGRGRTYGLDVEVPTRTWSRLGVRARGNLFTALLDGRELFEVELRVQGSVMAVASGRNKKEAEQRAAKAGLEKLDG